MATEPATVKSISSAICRFKIGQTVVETQEPKVTENLNGFTKLVVRSGDI